MQVSGQSDIWILTVINTCLHLTRGLVKEVMKVGGEGGWGEWRGWAERVARVGGESGKGWA